jgi:hypothetical protein
MTTPRSVDECFFQAWSPGMAYVLGVLYSDGCLYDKKGYFVVSVSQKEKELLSKCLNLMKSNATIHCAISARSRKYIHSFNISNQNLCRDLLALGVVPRKSRILTYPTIPPEFERHFLRGCWDGDGFICVEKTSGRWRSGYTSASFAFIAGFRDALVRHGLPAKSVWRRKNSNVYDIRLTTDRELTQLRDLLYNGVFNESLYLQRKRDGFFRAVTDNQKIATAKICNRIINKQRLGRRKNREQSVIKKVERLVIWAPDGKYLLARKQDQVWQVRRLRVPRLPLFTKQSDKGYPVKMAGQTRPSPSTSDNAPL